MSKAIPGTVKRAVSRAAASPLARLDAKVQAAEASLNDHLAGPKPRGRLSLLLEGLVQRLRRAIAESSRRLDRGRIATLQAAVNQAPTTTPVNQPEPAVASPRPDPKVPALPAQPKDHLAGARLEVGVARFMLVAVMAAIATALALPVTGKLAGHVSGLPTGLAIGAGILLGLLTLRLARRDQVAWERKSLAAGVLAPRKIRAINLLEREHLRLLGVAPNPAKVSEWLADRHDASGSLGRYRRFDNLAFLSCVVGCSSAGFWSGVETAGQFGLGILTASLPAVGLCLLGALGAHLALGIPRDAQLEDALDRAWQAWRSESERIRALGKEAERLAREASAASARQGRKAVRSGNDRKACDARVVRVAEKDEEIARIDRRIEEIASARDARTQWERIRKDLATRLRDAIDAREAALAGDPGKQEHLRLDKQDAQRRSRLWSAILLLAGPVITYPAAIVLQEANSDWGSSYLPGTSVPFSPVGTALWMLVLAVAEIALVYAVVAIAGARDPLGVAERGQGPEKRLSALKRKIRDRAETWADLWPAVLLALPVVAAAMVLEILGNASYMVSVSESESWARLTLPALPSIIFLGFSIPLCSAHVASHRLGKALRCTSSPQPAEVSPAAQGPAAAPDYRPASVGRVAFTPTLEPFGKVAPGTWPSGDAGPANLAPDGILAAEGTIVPPTWVPYRSNGNGIHH